MQDPTRDFQLPPVVNDLLVTAVRSYLAGAGTSETKVIITKNDLILDPSPGY